MDHHLTDADILDIGIFSDAVAKDPPRRLLFGEDPARVIAEIRRNAEGGGEESWPTRKQ